MAVPGRLELPTFGLGNRCSIRLSYGTWGAFASARARPLAGRPLYHTCCGARPDAPQCRRILAFALTAMVSWRQDVFAVAIACALVMNDGRQAVAQEPAPV